MNAATDIGHALRDRMEAATAASLTVTKQGGMWRIVYTDPHDYSEAYSHDPGAAAALLCNQLGISYER